MYKLKIVQPKPLKVKFSVAFPPIILANLQEKTIVPLTDEVVVTADDSFDRLSKVTVGAIPSEYIIPSGELDITENGTYDVTNYVNANVNIPEKQLGIKTITSNGTYKATDDDLDGYSEVEVATSGVDINDYFITSPNANETLSKWIKEIPPIDTSNYTNMSNMLLGCSSLTSLPPFNTSKVKSFSTTFGNCKGLQNVPQFDASSATNVSSMFEGCRSLINFGGLLNLGQAFSTTTAANNYMCKLDLSYSIQLTHESIMNVINNLYDIASKGCNTQQLMLGKTNLAKLTAEEVAIATNKGFNVS